MILSCETSGSEGGACLAQPLTFCNLVDIMSFNRVDRSAQEPPAAGTSPADPPGCPTHHNTCKWCCSPGTEPGGCARRQVHGGS